MKTIQQPCGASGGFVGRGRVVSFVGLWVIKMERKVTCHYLSVEHK